MYRKDEIEELEMLAKMYKAVFNSPYRMVGQLNTLKKEIDKYNQWKLSKTTKQSKIF